LEVEPKRKQLDKHLHIICLTIPYPVDFGGAFDLFYKLEALKQLQVKIHLHCFQHLRDEQPKLNEYCETVHYYPRKTGVGAVSSKFPYIVKSRRSRALADMLAKDDYPILAEGVHCTWLLNDKRFEKKRFFVRLHNVEYIYYRNLYSFEYFLPRKMYFLWESFLLKRYETRLAKNTTVLAVSEKDALVYRKLGCERAFYLSVFLPPWPVNMEEGKGTFCLFHGDLGVTENEKAAKWLLKHVFNDTTIPFVIAGKNPSRMLGKMVHANQFSCLIANPGHEEMQDLVEKAHINVIPSYNPTGIKLKLLNALFNGKHCIVNKTTIGGSGLEKACVVVEDAASFKNAINEAYSRSFTNDDIIRRRELFGQMYDNAKSAEKLVQIIWPD
jgi:glycosyltransferase involved in cell wall biosynthesis